MSGSWKRIGVVLAASRALRRRRDDGRKRASRWREPHGRIETLNIMGFGTNGDDVAKSRFAIAQQAIAPDTVSAPNGGFNDQQFLAAVASGNPPDLVYMIRERSAHTPPTVPFSR